MRGGGERDRERELNTFAWLDQCQCYNELLIQPTFLMCSTLRKNGFFVFPHRERFQIKPFRVPCRTVERVLHGTKKGSTWNQKGST